LLIMIENIRKSLAAYWGYKDFLPLQEDAMQCIERYGAAKAYHPNWLSTSQGSRADQKQAVRENRHCRHQRLLRREFNQDGCESALSVLGPAVRIRRYHVFGYDDFAFQGFDIWLNAKPQIRR